MTTIRTRSSRLWFPVLVASVLGCGSSSSGSRPGVTGGAAGHADAGGGSAGTAAGAAGQTASGGTSGSGAGAAGGAAGHTTGGAGGAAPSCSARVACSNPDLVCDTDTGTCVECLDDTDCAPQHCDVTQHVCVDCLLNSDCPKTAPNCSTGHTCGAACNNSNSCPTDTPVCEASTHACVECLVNSDCDPNGFCQPDRTCR